MERSPPVARRHPWIRAKCPDCARRARATSRRSTDSTCVRYGHTAKLWHGPASRPEQQHVVLHGPERGKIPQLWGRTQPVQGEEEKREGRRSRTQVKETRVRRRIPKSGRRGHVRTSGLYLCLSETETCFSTHWMLAEWKRGAWAGPLQTAPSHGDIDTRCQIGTIRATDTANTLPSC